VVKGETRAKLITLSLIDNVQKWT